MSIFNRDYLIQERGYQSIGKRYGYEWLVKKVPEGFQLEAVHPKTKVADMRFSKFVSDELWDVLSEAKAFVDRSGHNDPNAESL
jgi:hypothetical protein